MARTDLGDEAVDGSRPPTADLVVPRLLPQRHLRCDDFRRPVGPDDLSLRAQEVRVPGGEVSIVDGRLGVLQERASRVGPVWLGGCVALQGATVQFGLEIRDVSPEPAFAGRWAHPEDIS